MADLIFKGRDAAKGFQVLDEVLRVDPSNIHNYVKLKKNDLLKKDELDYSVHIAFGLGCLAMAGVHLLLVSDWLYPFGFYLLSLGVCHLLEYTYVWRFHPGEVSADSFLLNNKGYKMAASAAIAEYFIESFLFPDYKNLAVCFVVGGFFAIIFQGVRTVAMWTAGQHFHHQVRDGPKDEKHKLVTDGIYAIMRHPSYVGWFYWSLSTQIVLCNPVSFCVFAYVLWQFFSDRIEYEEANLIKFFGDDYRDFQKKVPTYLPLIK
eukprot:TRINITY_DN4072_c0_g1_i1.p1 TRINITY_DN4072_c0_g1~~TRINITY_DN4072_c0_g1_i1.p1  ORF type:complete len:276 (-),score=58.44 TRINITY_DN4072_c0_g1_i1:29-814(-)